jgi:MYXO-CTERM domain-containing protein
VQAPLPGETVPTNAKIWLGTDLGGTGDVLFPGERLVLLDADGDAVEPMEGTIHTVDGPLQVLDPGELRPETAYELWKCDATRCDSEVLHFVTGTERDDEPPSLPEEIDRTHDGHGPGPCGRAAWVELSVEHDGILLADLGERAVVAGPLFGSVTVATTEKSFMVGRGGCSTGFPSGDTSTIRYSAFDVAGNFSGWTEPDPIELRGCRCAAGPSDPPVWIGLLVLIAFRRRRIRS